jgi:hypothetical protein
VLLGVKDETAQSRWRSQSLLLVSLAGSVTPMEQMKANLGRLGSFTERAVTFLKTLNTTYRFKNFTILKLFFTKTNYLHLCRFVD